MDRYFYSIELDDNKNKVLHIFGNVYFNVSNNENDDYRLAEYTYLYIDIIEAKKMIAEDNFFNYVNSRVSYLLDFTEIEVLQVCKNYFNGSPGTKLHILDITDKTPCGDYWFEG